VDARVTKSILTINSGSSSLKFGIYSAVATLRQPPFSGELTGIGKASSGLLTIQDESGREVDREERNFASQHEAFFSIADRLQQLSNDPIAAIGHRIVHGGPGLREHQLLSPSVLDTLQAAIHFAPLHIPPALELIGSAQERFAGTPQYACFDTAFHVTMPPEAFTCAIPRAYRDAGIQRYGFHGLSYESIVHAMQPEVPQRLVAAHLGSGASLCAMRDGRSVDTSMGVSPTGGIPMGTRTGDLDPGVLLMMLRGIPERIDGLGPGDLEQLVNHQAGLLALSGTTSDMRQLAETDSEDARLAIAIFCREIAKTIAAYAAVLGGLDTLVFTGGIGEHSSQVREKVCGQLEVLGIQLGARPPTAGGRISAEESRVEVLVLKSGEDRQIADHVIRLMASRG
jgi:acetate kinase